MSKAYERAMARARKLDRTLKATEPGFQNVVQITNEEGSTHFFRSAFLRKWVDPQKNLWILCFSEHEGFHAWAAESLYQWAEYSRRTL